MATFEYYINLNERGSFYADVRNESGETVYEIHSDDETGEIMQIESGYMRNVDDIQGLADYLKTAGFMGKQDSLIKAN